MGVGVVHMMICVLGRMLWEGGEGTLTDLVPLRCLRGRYLSSCGAAVELGVGEVKTEGGGNAENAESAAEGFKVLRGWVESGPFRWTGCHVGTSLCAYSHQLGRVDVMDGQSTALKVQPGALLEDRQCKGRVYSDF